MDSLIFALSAITPIMIIISVGYLLKQLGIINQTIVIGGNKIVFYCLLPLLIFVNIYKITDLSDLSPSFAIYSALMIIAAFLIGIPITAAITSDQKKRGPVLQCMFRSNYALIGIPLATAMFGAQGGAFASLMSAITIPLFNLLAVISLLIYKDSEAKMPSAKKILLNTAKNPLTLAAVAGVVAIMLRSLLRQHSIDFRISDITVLFDAVELMAQAATPLALILLGAQFEFSQISSSKREIALCVLIRNLIVPLVAISIACMIPSFEKVHLVVLVAMFATPLAVSSVPMSQESGADAKLAGSLVVFTTMVSALTLFLFIFTLHYLKFI